MTSPVLRGTYPTGYTWSAVELDKGRVRIVTDDNERQTTTVWMRPAPGALFQSRVSWDDQEVSSGLFNIFHYFDPVEFPEFAAWVEAAVPQAVLLDSLRRYYSWSLKGWQALFVEAPIVSLEDVVEWLQTTDMQEQDKGSWLYVEAEYDGGDLYRHRSLRLFDMLKDEKPYLLLVCRDYLDDSEDMETTPICSVEDLKEALTADTTTSLMLREVHNFSELERRLV